MPNFKLIVFDLDGTLTETKSTMDAGMSRLLCDLLSEKSVAVIGGGKYELFKKQFLSKLHCQKERLKRLYIFPTTSASFYRYGKHGWQKKYEYELPLIKRKRIIEAFKSVFKEFGYKHPEKTYGKVIEDRGSQVTFSVFGQDIAERLGQRGIAIKKEWKRKNQNLKLRMARRLQKLLPDFEVGVAGYTSIDVTQKGVDKAYGVRQIGKLLKVPIKDMLFVGDALEPGGNDYAARKTGVRCIEVSGPEETKKLIKDILDKK